MTDVNTKGHRRSKGKITKGDITSGEYIRDQKEIYEFPVAKLPKDRRIKDALFEQRKSGAGYSGSEDYKQ